MAKGDGSIQQLGRSKWRVSVYHGGKDPVTGKYRRSTHVVHGTKADAKRFKDELQRSLCDGIRIDDARVTFGEFANQWLETREASKAVCDQRASLERGHVRDMCAYIGNTPICDITPQVLERLYSRIRADKKRKRGAVSNRTMRDLNATMRQIMKKAVNYDLILKNPCDYVELARPEEPNRRSLDAAECRKMIAALDAKEAEGLAASKSNGAVVPGIKGLSNVMAVRIALATGMRRGEVFGATWGAVDLSTGVIHVRQSLTAGGEIKPPKTRSGLRSISLDRSTTAHLGAWKRAQAEYLETIGLEQTGETPVCCSNTGGWSDLHNFETWWRAFRDASGFEGVKFHELRHTQATQLLANGVDIKTVQTRMGHSNAGVTLNWYAHAVAGNDKEAANVIDGLFDAHEEEPRFRVVRTA